MAAGAERAGAVRVGVHPPAELERRPRLFAALAGAFPVAFEPAGADAAALLVLGDGAGAPAEDGRRRFVVAGSEEGGGAAGTVAFGRSERLDARLRGRALTEDAPPPPLEPREGDELLAEAGGRPLWVRRGASDVVARFPAELGPAEFLRDRLDPGRFAELLPLVHFLRAAGAPAAWEPPPLRASFIVDDPNLHWRSYGHLRYPDLIAHARRHRYHLAVAMVPIDGWFSHGPTVRRFAESGDVLSLCVHGNDHRMHELGKLRSVDEARRVLAQSARRIAAFERRSGLSVSRVVVPPFEACSAESAQAMLELGFDGLSHTRPYPWTPLGPGDSSHASPEADHVLSGWWPAELVAGGLPVIVRRELHQHDEIVLRAFLDQPIVLYGHVEDLGDGLEPFAAAASVVNSLPSVRWGSLAWLAETNVARRRESSALALRPYARRVCVDVGADVTALSLPGASQPRVRAAGAELSPGADGRFALPDGRQGPIAVEARWPAPREIEPASVERPSFAAHPRARRLLVEARDRLDPLARRLRTRARG